jgi:acetylornithine deacetylase
MKPDVVDTLQQLIRIPSVNPMGRNATGGPYFEQALSDYLVQFFQALHVPVNRQPVAPQRENVVARLDGRRDGEPAPVVVFDVHQDTVPVEGMTIAPWEPVVDEGRVYGRGACDVKGAMACLLTAFARLVQERPAGMPTLIMACTVNEENGFTGAQALSEAWGSGTLPLVASQPQQVIVAEPTDLNVVVTHKGVVRWRCHTLGRATHSSSPEQGENAIYHMGHLILQLERYAQWLRTSAIDPRLGPPTLNVGTIHGGICANAVPDLCTIEIDRRLVPVEDPDAARQQVVDWLAGNVPQTARMRHDPPYLVSRGLSGKENVELAERLLEVVRGTGCAARQIGVPYGTNAPFYAASGIPTVVFGPGSIDQAHTANEWIAIDQLHRAVEIYYRLGRGATLGGATDQA